MISLSNPLDVTTGQASYGEQPQHLTPTWMKLLPSSRMSFEAGPHQNIASRRSTLTGGIPTLSKPSSTTLPSHSTHSTPKESPLQEPPSQPRPERDPHFPPVADPLADPPPVIEDVSKANPVLGRRGTRDPPGLLETIERYRMGPDRELRGGSPPHHIPTSNPINELPLCRDQEIFHESPSGQAQSSRNLFSQQLFHRSDSLPPRRFSLRKISTTASTSTHVPAASGTCRSEKSHTPLPSQDISPAKTPLLRELSSFFATRAGK